MASTALVLSTVVMGVFLVGLAVVTSRFVKRTDYGPRLRPQEDAEHGTLLTANVLGALLAVVLLVIIGAAVAMGDVTLILMTVPAAAIAGYIAWGVYHMAQTRGLPVSYSVALSAWMVGTLLVAVIAINLLVA